MMRCIQSAVDQGHISPNEGRELHERIAKLLNEGLAPPQVRQRMLEELDAATKLENRRTMLQENRRVILTAAVLNHKNARGENDPAEALALLLEHHGNARFPSLEYRRMAIIGEVHSEMRAVLHEFRKGFLGDLRRDAPRIRARLENMVREAFGEDSGDAQAKALAAAWGAAAERLRQRYNEAGGNIGKLDRYGLPQTHNREAILKLGQQKWVDYLMRDGVLDRERMVSRQGHQLTDGELREVLGEVWETITTDGWFNREPTYQAYGKGKLAQQLDEHHRWLHFKNADEWLSYQKQFGEGDHYTTMTHHVAKMARDIATMEILGPNPEGMRNYLKQLVTKYAGAVPPVQRVIGEETGKIEARLARLVGDEMAGHWTGRLVQALRDLSEADRRLKSLAPTIDATAHQAARADAEKAVQRLVKGLDDLEPLSIGERRSDLTGDIAMKKNEIEALKNRRNPDGGGMSKRRKRQLAGLKEELATLERQLAEVDAGGAQSIVDIDPKAQREIVASVMRLRDEALREDLTQHVVAGFRPVKDPMVAAEKAILRHDRMWDIIRGTHFAPVSTFWADTMQSARNLMTATLLGSAATTAFIGDPVYSRFARLFSGLPTGYVRILAGAIDGMRNATRQEAVEAMLVLDSALHSINRHGAYLEDTGFRRDKSWGKSAVDVTGFLADRVLAASLLTRWTYGMKHAFGLDFMRTMAKNRDEALDGLPPAMQHQLARYGITAADWDVMRRAELHDATRGSFIDDLLKPLIGGYTMLRPNEIAKIDRGVAEKYLSMILAETRRAVPEHTVRGRVFFEGGRRGTLPGEVALNISQFKSFPVTIMTLQLGMMRELYQSGQRMRAARMGTEYLILGCIVGAVANELFEIYNGRDPVLPRIIREGKTPNAEYWWRAMLKHGGMGVIGDYVAAPVNRFGAGLISTIAGPLPGEVEKIRNRAAGGVLEYFDDNVKSKKAHAGRNVADTVRELTPGRTLWWGRLAMDRFVFNQLQLALDPNAEDNWRRHAKMQKKALGNEFWWKPGETAPERGPALNGDVPR